VIVRISTEGQYELLGNDEEVLNTLDNEAVAACEAGDAEQFRDAYANLVSFVRGNGQPVPEDQLGPSDVIFPPPDVSLEEAREEFTGEGLIPG
jgi:PspA-Associated protein